MVSPSRTSWKSGNALALSIPPALAKSFSEILLAIPQPLWYNTRMKDLEIIGDMIEDVEQHLRDLVLNEMADGCEMTEEEIDAWGDLWEAKNSPYTVEEN